MMPDAPAPLDPNGRLARLTAYLATDPDNVRLLADAAEAAFAAAQFDATLDLLDRHARVAPLPPQALNLAGLAAMRLHQWQLAADRFAALMDGGADAPAVRFNRAWSLAMAKQFDAALPLLDDATTTELPQAAQLAVQLLHQDGDMDAAEALARTAIERHPDHRGLNAAVATLAIDIEDLDLAARCAERAGDHPEALTTRATLALGDDQVTEAAQLFEAALERDPHAPRAWVGHGLAQLLAGNPAQAAQELDKGAALFSTHIGSWIAAGWAYFIARDLASARQRFETALALDDSFAESHGSLAVIAILEGRLDDAKQQTQVALRLDRQSFSGALASTLLAAGAGDTARAQQIVERALRTPIDANGRTIEQALARLGTGMG